MAKVKIIWIKSSIGYAQDQRQTLRALGLQRVHHWVIHPDSPSLRGMVEKVKHLVKVEVVDEAG